MWWFSKKKKGGKSEYVYPYLTVEDHTSPRPTQCLMRGGGDDVAVVEGALDDVGGDQTRDVSHVGQQDRLLVIADLRSTKEKLQGAYKFSKIN